MADAPDPVLADSPAAADSPETTEPSLTNELTSKTRSVTLQSLVDNVGPGILEVLRAPIGLEPVVGELVIHDPVDDHGINSGDVILAVGVEPSSRGATDLVLRAGAADAAAVIFKLDFGRSAGTLIEASVDGGVALLAVAPAVVWGQLHVLLRTARAAAGDPGDVGPGGAPVGDLFALANAVASMVGGATTIEDPRSTVLAYSSTDSPIDEPRQMTILGRRVPEDWRRQLEDDGVFRRLWSGGVVRVELVNVDKKYRNRVAVAVQAGGEILGSIWVVEGDRPLDAQAEAALAEAGRITALHLLRHRAGEDLERRRRADLLRSVLNGRVAPAAVASSLGIPAASFVTVVAFELDLDSEGTLADQTVIVDRAVNMITVHCEVFHRQVATAGEGQVVYVLLPDRTAPDPDRLVSFASSIVEHLGTTLGVAARAGVGTTINGLVGVLESREDSDKALRALSHEAKRNVAHIDTVRSRAVLLALRDLAAEHPSLRAGRVDRLLAFDRDRNGAYIQTLRAFLDAFGDVAVAAERVHVHPNTLRYRIRRLTEVSGIDLDDPVERLVSHLQLTFVEDDTYGEDCP